MIKKYVFLFLFFVSMINIPVVGMDLKNLYPENNYQKLALGFAALSVPSGIAYGYGTGLASSQGVNTLIGASGHLASLMLVGIPLLSVSLYTMKGMPEFLTKIIGIKQGLTKDRFLNTGVGAVQAAGAFLTLGLAAVSGRFAGDFIGHCSGQLAPYALSVLSKM